MRAKGNKKKPVTPAAPSVEPCLLLDGRRFFTFLFAQLHCVVFFYLFSTAQKSCSWRRRLQWTVWTEPRSYVFTAAA